jgi:hypothetical protein
MEPTNAGGQGLPPSGGHYFYMVAIRETLDRGQPQEIQALLDGAKQVREKYGDLDGLIRELEAVAKPEIPSRPHRPFYMVAVRETIDGGDPAAISALLEDARGVQSEYGGLDALIADLEKASGSGSGSY